MNDVDRTRPPAQCNALQDDFSRCEGRRFKRLESGRFECRTCGRDHYPKTITTTQRRIALCRHCGESFLWNAKPRLGLQTAPRQCRACGHQGQAYHYRKAAEKHDQKAVEARAQQRRAVARFKPPESAA